MTENTEIRDTGQKFLAFLDRIDPIADDVARALGGFAGCYVVCEFGVDRLFDIEAPNILYVGVSAVAAFFSVRDGRKSSS